MGGKVSAEDGRMPEGAETVTGCNTSEGWWGFPVFTSSA